MYETYHNIEYNKECSFIIVPGVEDSTKVIVGFLLYDDVDASETFNISGGNTLSGSVDLNSIIEEVTVSLDLESQDYLNILL